MAQQILPQEELHRLFDYKDGNLYWKIKPANRTNIGDVVGCIDKHNLYIRSRYKEKCYLVHRLIFAWHYGYYPKMIDHIDGFPVRWIYLKMKTISFSNPGIMFI